MASRRTVAGSAKKNGSKKAPERKRAVKRAVRSASGRKGAATSAVKSSAAGKKPRQNGLTLLRPVGLSEDGTAVILAPRARGKGAYKIAIDDSLVAQLVAARDLIEKQPPVAGRAPAVPAAPPVESGLTIKEIQAALREGRSVEWVAKKAGVDPTWVERFEGPIVWERDGMARRAQRAVVVRSRRGPSDLPLGAAVIANLRRRRVAITEDQVEAGWDSVKERGGTWRVRFTFTSRGRPRVAEWRFDPETADVTAVNDLANGLGWVEPKRRRRSSP